ncbi:Arc family DNA-binding protein [Delftia sp. BR1]|nr:Arc family DNA-binding protein [Delftia sp. BR1]
MARTTTAPTGQIAPLGLRMLPQMRERIEQAARESGRSLNAEIVHRLAQTLGEDFAAEQPAAQPVLAEMLAQMREQTGLLRELVELARDAANPDGAD